MDKIHENLTENIKTRFLQNLKPDVKRAVAEATENEKDASSSEDEESNEEDRNKEESGKGESAGDQSSSDQDSGEVSIDEGEEQEELTSVEQAEFMEQHKSYFFSGNFSNLNYETFRMRNE